MTEADRDSETATLEGDDNNSSRCQEAEASSKS